MEKYEYYAENKPSMLEDFLKNSYANQSWKDWYIKNRNDPKYRKKQNTLDLI